MRTGLAAAKAVCLRVRWCVLLVVIMSLLARPAARSLTAQPLDRSVPSGAFCLPVSPPTGNIVNVSTVAQLQQAVTRLDPGTTVLIADGTYYMNGAYLWIDTPNVTVRSASGNRDSVILDGNYETTEMITVAASNVTIADLTLRRAETHAIHVVSTDSGHTLNALIYNVHILDSGQQAIKINPHGARIYFPDSGVVACSRIELTDAGRPHVWEINGSCYTGGVDGHQARGWTIRDNHVEGFWCPNDLAEHAVHFWTGSRDTLVERNVLVDNARGIGLGLLQEGNGRTYGDDPCPGAGYVGHYGGVIRNNWLFASRDVLFSSEYGFDCGICLAQACDAHVLHNSIISTQAPFSSIEWRFENTQARIINNLASHNLRDRGGTAFLAGNLSSAPLSLFVDGPDGDLHLVPGATAAIDRGTALASGVCDKDIDGDPRPIGAARDIGADEYFAFVPSHHLFLPLVIRS